MGARPGNMPLLQSLKIFCCARCYNHVGANAPSSPTKSAAAAGPKATENKQDLLPASGCPDCSMTVSL